MARLHDPAGQAQDEPGDRAVAQPPADEAAGQRAAGRATGGEGAGSVLQACERDGHEDLDGVLVVGPAERCAEVAGQGRAEGVVGPLPAAPRPGAGPEVEVRVVRVEALGAQPGGSVRVERVGRVAGQLGLQDGVEPLAALQVELAGQLPAAAVAPAHESQAADVVPAPRTVLELDGQQRVHELLERGAQLVDRQVLGQHDEGRLEPGELAGGRRPHLAQPVGQGVQHRVALVRAAAGLRDQREHAVAHHPGQRLLGRLPVDPPVGPVDVAAQAADRGLQSHGGREGQPPRGQLSGHERQPRQPTRQRQLARRHRGALLAHPGPGRPGLLEPVEAALLDVGERAGADRQQSLLGLEHHPGRGQRLRAVELGRLPGAQRLDGVVQPLHGLGQRHRRGRPVHPGRGPLVDGGVTGLEHVFDVTRGGTVGRGPVDNGNPALTCDDVLVTGVQSGLVAGPSAAGGRAARVGEPGVADDLVVVVRLAALGAAGHRPGRQVLRRCVQVADLRRAHERGQEPLEQAPPLPPSTCARHVTVPSSDIVPAPAPPDLLGPCPLRAPTTRTFPGRPAAAPTVGSR